MKRSEELKELKQFEGEWDLVIIGGGATGLGVAVDAASRGYKTLLAEMHDFSKGTSSRSTKLVHGGVRYLQQGDVSLVIEALHERGLLIQNAPHLVNHQSFIVPSYEWWNGPFYGIGLKVYDMLAGKLGIKKSENISREKTLKHIPTLEPDELRGGVMYYDAQFDDSRLAVHLAMTADEHGASLINYMKVTGLIKNEEGLCKGVELEDRLSGEQLSVRSKVVVNCTGIFTDQIMKMDNPDQEEIIQCAQGIHLVLDKDFLPGDTAIMVPQTDDGRVLFAVPWHDKVIIGTTDTALEGPSAEPVAKEEEIEFLLKHAADYLTRNPQRSDVKSVFAGIRPLVRNPDAGSTSEISRNHEIMVSASGLLTIAGGKWTTYRKMAEDTVNRAALLGGLQEVDCKTKELAIHGHNDDAKHEGHLYVYGSDLPVLKKLMAEDSEWSEQLHPDLPYLKAEVIWAVRYEMAMTVEDVLARRTRALFLDAAAAIDSAVVVAELMKQEMGESEDWKEEQICSFKSTAESYLLV